MRTFAAFLGTFCMVVVACELLAIATLFATGQIDRGRIVRTVEVWTEDDCGDCFDCDDCLAVEPDVQRMADVNDTPRR